MTASGALSYAGAPLDWQGITVLPGWRDLRGGCDILPEHAARTGADLVITLCDGLVLRPESLRGLNVACWLPVDCYPADTAEAGGLVKAGARLIAMSRFGENALREAGFDPLYVPHAADCAVFCPQDGAALREQAGISAETFVIVMVALNKDAIRKGFAEQFRAFAAFRQKHPDALLLVHSLAADPQALNLEALAAACGISEAVLFPDQYEYATGQISQAQMARLYGLADILSCCSYGEGFGIPVLEAQACGVPAVVTDCSAMTELRGAGWKVPGDPFWVPVHSAWWKRPGVASVTAAYEQAWQAREDGTMAGLRDRAREFALGYDADLVAARYWKPALEALAPGCG